MTETAETDQRKLHDQLFARLVSWLYTTCLQNLGKLADADTGEVEFDLPAARTAIEMMRMLEAKTEGNLSSVERETVAEVLSNLETNYAGCLRSAPVPAGRKGGNGEGSMGSAGGGNGRSKA